MKAMTGRTVAIDASMSLYQFLVAVRQGADQSNLSNASGEITSHIQGFLSRTVKMLELGVKVCKTHLFSPQFPECGTLFACATLFHTFSSDHARALLGTHIPACSPPTSSMASRPTSRRPSSPAAPVSLAWQRAVGPAHLGPSCPGRKPPFWGGKRPAHPYKSTIQTFDLLWQTLRALNRPGRAWTGS